MKKFMKRHKLLVLGLMLIFLVSLIAGCGSGGDKKDAAQSGGEKEKPKVMKMRLAQSKADSHHVSKGYVKFAELVKEKSNGQIQIEVFNNAVLGSDRECIESAQKGTLEFAGSSTPNMSSFTNKFIAFDLPYIFENKDEVYKAIDGEPGKEIRQELEKVGFKVIFFPDYGFRQVVNNLREVKVPADLKGMKVRTTNSPVEIADFKAFGANPTPIAWAEVFTALQQGTVNGEGNSYSLLWDTKHHEVLKYAVEVNYNYSSDIGVMNKAIYDKLSPELQKIIMEAGEEATKWERELANKSDDEAKKKFIDYGIKIYEPTPDEYRQWKLAAKPVWNEFVVPGQADPEFVDKILKAIGKTKEDIFK